MRPLASRMMQIHYPNGVRAGNGWGTEDVGEGGEEEGAMRGIV